MRISVCSGLTILRLPSMIFSKHFFLKLLSILVLIIFLGGIAEANVRWSALAQPVFQTIEHDSLPIDGPIRATAQDRDGYIWLVSDNKLLRWDAYQLSSIPFQITHKKQAFAPDVNTIKADPSGKLWVGTSNGLYQINQQTLRLELVNVKNLNNQPIDLLEFDYHDGKMHGFIGNDISVFEWVVGTPNAQSLKLGENLKNRAITIAIDKKHNLWIGTLDGLFTKSLIDSTNTALHLSKKIPGLDYISALYVDSTQQIWIGSAKNGVYMLDQQQKLHSITLPSNDSSNPWIYDITEISPGIIWFGTFGKGIIEYRTNNSTFTSIRQQRGLNRNLLDNDIWSFFKDKRGLIWIGSRRGVNIYNPSQSAFKYIPGDMDGPNGLPDSQIYSVLSTSDDQLWLGTGSKGIEIIHPENGRVKQMPTGMQIGKNQIPNDAIETIFLKDENTILAGSNWNTLEISRAPMSIQALTIPGRNSDAFSSAFTMHNHKLWIGGIDGLWQIPTNKIDEPSNVLSKISSEYRTSALLSDDDTLWIGTWRGLLTLTGNDANAIAYKITSISDPIFSQQYISTLRKDSKNRIWVGTYSAGLFYNSKERIANNKPWISISEKEGLPGNSISSIQIDLEGNLWVATTQGIACIDVNTLNVAAVSREEGATAAPYENGTVTVAGEIVFVGNNGINIIQPKLWDKTQFKAPIVISHIASNSDKPLIIEKIKSANNILQNKLILSADINRITIEFAALDYIAAARLHYRYRLVGFDTKWIESDAKHRTVTFTRLAPKNYALQVQYSLDGINWQSDTFNLTIEVQPAWYQQTWLHILLFTGLFVLILWVIRWRSNRILAYQHQLEQRILDRTSELESAYELLQSQSLAIEEASLTDPLTGLRNRRFFSQHIDADISLTQRVYLNNYTAPNELKNSDLIFFLIDIDYFKKINDKWGHANGDAVLIEMHNRLKSVFRDSDYIVRWGGEEFLAVARGTSRLKATDLAERICQSVSNQAIALTNGQMQTVTCSIGYAAYPFFTDQPHALTWSETLAIADAGLYSAKKSGRNTWVGFDTTNVQSNHAQISHIKISPKAALQMTNILVRQGSKPDTLL